MNQEQAKQALEEECKDHLKRVFGILAANLIDQTEEEAVGEFKESIAHHLRAHALAVAAIEAIFRD